MEDNNFEWVGECVPTQKRKRYQLHYTAFSNGDLHVQVGDFVLIRNEDSFDPEQCCFIAQVIDLYEADDEYDAPYRAVVQWFSRMIEFPAHLLQSLNGVDYHTEVVKEERNYWSNVISTDTIFAKCSIVFLPTNVSPLIAVTAYDATKNLKLFFCRWQYTGAGFEPVVVSKVGELPVMKKTNKTESKEHTHSSNSKMKTGEKVSALSSSNTSKSTPMKNNTDAVPKRKTRASARKSLASVQNEKSEVENVFSTKRISICLERTYESLPKEFSPNDICQPLVVKLKDHCAIKSSTRAERTPVKNARLSNDSSPDKSDSQILKNGDVSESENGDLVPLSLQTTPVKRFYSPKKKPCRILDNSPYFKQFRSLNGAECQGTHLDSSEQLASPLKSVQKEQSVVKEGSRYDKPESKKKDTLSSSVARRNLFCNDEDDSSKAEKISTPVRPLFSDSNASTTGKGQGHTSTSRYGRTVKCKYSFAEIDNSPRKANTPKKRIIPKRNASHKKKSVVYNSDVSDSGSSYSPSEKSSEDEDENFEEERPATTNLRSPKIRSGGKSSSKKNKKTLSNIPSIPERSEPLKTPQNVLEVCRQRLHVSAVPKSLPCREDEYADIYTFIESNLTNGTGGCMYISGVPGTGKTATVFEVMRNLQSERENDSVPPFDFVEINGMRMTDPHQSYVQIHKGLTGETVAPQQAADLLEKRFTKPGYQKKAVVLIVDELDLLWTRKQTVMYNIFDWPSKTHSKLIVIAIANAMDLPERLLMSRISSRLGLTRKTFQPYTFKQLQEIVMCRIRELQTFDPDAVQLVARKVAAVSGDARRALDVCRRAAEIAEERKIPISPKKGSKILVGLAHVDLALQEMFTSPMIKAIKSASLIQKMFLRGVVAEFQRTGLEETVFTKAHGRFISLCRFEGIRPPNTSQVFLACAHLATSRLLLVDSSANDIYQKIRLNVSVDDVNYALSEQKL